jgi:ribosomal protein S18 acetylase RimI-like enzyme
LGRRRKTPAEEVAAVALVLALGGDRLAALAEAWNASGLGQVLDVWTAVLGRGRSRRGGGLRRLAAFLLGVVVCALVCHMRGAAFLEGFQKTGGGRKLMRIFLH